MSKKKNTLSDLEEFLKLQASSLVTPPSVSEKAKSVPPPANTSATTSAIEATAPANEKDVPALVTELAAANSQRFYDLVLQAAENLRDTQEAKTLLINTALYLKGGSHWKETVRDYWKKKKP
jgi:hypothetical protein